MSLIRLRRRFPLFVCLLLALTCLMAVGIVCTCSADQSLQSIQRIISTSGAALPAVIEVWGFLVLSFVALFVGPLLASEAPKRGRASPEFLQRFLF